MELPKLYHFPNETDEFIMPEFGSAESVDYIVSLKLENGQQIFAKGVHYLPTADVRKVCDQVPAIDMTQDIHEQKILHGLVFNRLSNRICESCGNKRDIRKLSICEGCCLSWYCSKECQTRHWPIHKQRCCVKDGPLDTGYQQIVLLKTK